MLSDSVLISRAFDGQGPHPGERSLGNHSTECAGDGGVRGNWRGSVSTSNRRAPLQNIAGPEQRKLLDQAVTVPSPATDAMSDGTLIGEPIRSGEGVVVADLDFTLIDKRRSKISPTYHERMIWGQGDGSGLRAVDSKIGRIGQLACWEHYNPLARYALMADGEQIHSAMYPGSIFGDLFSEQTEVNIRQHALESACFVVSATAWLDPDQQAQIIKDTGCGIGPISGGCLTAIVASASS
jgi:nitrilase